MDLLAHALTLSGVRGTLGARIEAAEEWGVLWSGIEGAAFYAVTSGTAWLGIDGRDPRQLMPGDVVLLPSGTAHTLSSDPHAAVLSCDTHIARCARRDGAVLRFGSGNVQTHILGASYQHDPAVSTQVLAALPDVVHIRGDNGGTCMDDTVRLLARELAYPQIATAVVLNSLVDILLVQLLRVWLGGKPAELKGTWLAALSDTLLSRALTVLHDDPARAWTTQSLAAELSVSRTTLSRRFLSVLGDPPATYLTRWRMDLAAIALRDTDDTLEAIAHSVGYTSVYAFSRAFSRIRAESPGRYRLSARAELPTAV